MLRAGRDVVVDSSFWSRAAREGTGPGDIRLTPEVAAAYYDGFEVPTPDEGPLRIVAGV